MAMNKDERLGWGCIAVIGLPLVVLVGYVFISDWQIRREVAKEFEARKKLDLAFFNNVEAAFKLCDEIAERANPEERVALRDAKGWFEMVDGASREGPDFYRLEKFTAVTNAVRELTKLKMILSTNLSISPTEAKKLINEFRIF